MYNCRERVMLAVVAAFMVSIPWAGCGSGDGAGMTPKQKAGASFYCQRMVTCKFLSSSEVGKCINDVIGTIQVIPDPDTFAACLETVPCGEMGTISATRIFECMDANLDSYICSDGDGLTGCTNSGKCDSVSCPEVCAAKGDYKFDHCGETRDSERQKNICMCRF
jgi:hypothetical protein